MDAPKVPPDPSKLVALEVERLFVQGDNRRIFAEQIEAFYREDAVRQAAETKAKESERAAKEAIVAEHDAVEAGKAKAYLTNSRTPPGEGWQWRTVLRGDDDIQGWVPPEVARDGAKDPAAWPANPSLATMFTLVSAFHDERLPMNRLILDRNTANRADANALTRARMWVVPAMKCDTKRFPALQGYVLHVARHLEEESAKARETFHLTPDAAFPWGRASLAFALLIVLELLAVRGAWQWGDGHNLLQKIGNCWWLLTSAFTVAIAVSYFILGKAGWSQVKKIWYSWRGV